MSTQSQTQTKLRRAPKRIVKRPARRPARKPAQVTEQAHHPTPASQTAAPSPVSQAPAIHEGIKPVQAAELLKTATPEQIKALMQTNFALWSQMSGVEVDNRKFEFDSHRYLLPIYLDENPEVIWMKSAQMGATIYQLLRLLWYARHQQVKAGLYFPTADGVTKLSKDRLTPLIKSNLDLLTHVSDATNTLGLKHINNIHGKLSSIYMLYMGGTASKDSVPLDIVAFDEVRLIDQAEIDQALERISHSTYKIKIFMSTAGAPNTDIHRRFLTGKQYFWHVKCSCSDGFIPSEVFPDCVVDTGKEVYLRCPKCKVRIINPQNGQYIAHNPRADASSYHISQFISQYITPAEIWEAYRTTTNMKEFFNAKLGKPYVDVENMPVTQEVLEACVDTNLQWANSIAAPRDRKRHCAMGVDQHSGNCCVVIAKRGRDGVKEFVHAEVIDSSNPEYWEDERPVSPFRRLHQLMKEFDVRMCVIDAMPNANEAQELARDFPGRVFIAWYQEMGQDMVRWHDRVKTREAIRKGSKKLRLKWQVVLHRYLSIDFALRQFTEGIFRMPDPNQLTQVCRSLETGRHEVEPIVKTRVWENLKSMVRQKTVLDEETGRFKMEWIYVNRDPHFTHAVAYLNIALERMRKQSMFTLV